MCPDSALPYASKKIRYVPIKPSGGKGFINKIYILLTMLPNLFIIHKICKRTDWIQFRAPTNLGLYVLPYLSMISGKKRWVKYAGNWNQPDPPFSYNFQKYWLKNNFQNSIVTINGRWPNQSQHLISFENPCLSIQEIDNAQSKKEKKDYKSKLNNCFVGRMEKEKGPDRILCSIENMREIDWIDTIYFVGEGKELNNYKQKGKNITAPNIVFTGPLSRKKLKEIYEKCHLIVLPTASEGFPKVIAEAITYGCIPIVSSAGSIGQYINNSNGMILRDLSIESISDSLSTIQRNRSSLKAMSIQGAKLSKYFSFDRYNRKIRSIISQ